MKPTFDKWEEGPYMNGYDIAAGAMQI